MYLNMGEIFEFWRHIFECGRLIFEYWQGVFYLLCSVIKIPKEETRRGPWYKFFEEGPLPLKNIVNRKPPPGGGVLRSN